MCFIFKFFRLSLKLFINIKSTQKFWQTWKEFEVAHGNEDTVREMLRIKRSVQATYNVQVNFMSAQMVAASSEATGGKLDA